MFNLEPKGVKKVLSPRSRLTHVDRKVILVATLLLGSETHFNIGRMRKVSGGAN